jgi:hypothetical protein
MTAAASSAGAAAAEANARSSLLDLVLATHDLHASAGVFHDVGIASIRTLADASNDILSVVKSSLGKPALFPSVDAARESAKRKLADIEEATAAAEAEEQDANAAAAAAAATAAAHAAAAEAAAHSHAADIRASKEFLATRDELRAHFSNNRLRAQLAKSLCKTASAEGKGSIRALAAKACFVDGKYDVRAGGTKPVPGTLLPSVTCELVEARDDADVPDGLCRLTPSIQCPVCLCDRRCVWRDAVRAPFRVKLQAANFVSHLVKEHPTAWDESRAQQRQAARFEAYVVRTPKSSS